MNEKRIMEILRDFNFIPYVDNLYTNHGKISFDSGTLLDIPIEGYYIVPDLLINISMGLTVVM